ncbi:hypothetical protein FCV25MIE_27875 [Fagus crenata]
MRSGPHRSRLLIWIANIDAVDDSSEASICKREASTEWNCSSMSDRWKLDSCFVAQHQSPWIEAYVKPLDRSLLEVFDLLLSLRFTGSEGFKLWFEGFDLLVPSA